MISIIYKCADKTLPFKFIGVALCLLKFNSQWKMLNYSSPPTHFTRAPPSHAKNCYLNSKLMILHASELATELFDEVQSPRCTFAIVIALPAWSRHVHGITQYKMASNIQLTKGRDREIAGLILLFR